MQKNLVIVESPAKAKTINKILGKDYMVRSSVGHIRDLPMRDLGVDIEDNFKPKYVMMKNKSKVISELKKAAQECDAIYLAPDPDREGEAIAWHLREVLKDAGRPFYRVSYNEITPTAVRAAFQHPGEVDQPRVDAQQARRVLDRIVGYMVSPMLWRRISRGLSAGRVQSVALRLLCEREAEIVKFVPEEYWVLGAKVRKMVVPLDPFVLRLLRIDGEKVDIHKREDAEGVKRDLEGRALRVAEIVSRETARRAPPPFITSTLQQAASTQLSFSPKRTMGLAQKLYEGIAVDGEHVGLITYMRTDSVNVSQEAVQACRAMIGSKIGADFCPAKPNFYRSRASAQEAHEAIRPTDVNRTPERLARVLEAPELRLYTLVWKRFVASQMTPARIMQRTVKVEALPDGERTTPYLFQANDSEIAFLGFMKVAGVPGKSREEKEASLPSLTEGEPLVCLEWLTEQKETQPPKRYSETSLVSALESNGIGRPSTYAQIISTLEDRKYVNIEKRTLFPTELGMQVSELLVAVLGDLFNVKFTAAMEESLDEIEKGTVNWTRMLGEFYASFEKWMEATKLPPADTGQVGVFLDLLTQVREWGPPVKRGKRTYSDEKFVESVRKQLVDGEKAISQKQLDALMKMACRYNTQIAGVDAALQACGQMAMLEQPDARPPKATTLRKLEVLGTLELDESAAKFVDSLRQRATGGRALTVNQLRALDNVVTSHAAVIEGFDSIKAELELTGPEPSQDTESAPLLEALAKVTEWKPAVTRGKRTFDDKVFCESVAGQFARKGSLSFRQVNVLKRMVGRYRAQIPEYEELVKQLGLGKKKSEAETPEESAE